MKTFKQELPVELNDNQLADRRDLLVDVLEQYDKVETEKKSVTSKLTNQLKRLRARSQKLANVIKTRTDMQLVECTKDVDLAARRVDIIRLDTGEIAESRPMKDEEYELYTQHQLGLEQEDPH